MIEFIRAGEAEKPMKIKVESEKIIKAVKKLNGIEVVLESAEDAKEAIDLVLRKAALASRAAVTAEGSHGHLISGVQDLGGGLQNGLSPGVRV